MNTEFRYFGTDEEKHSFVVFEVERENERNTFIWVYLDEDFEDEWRVEVSAVSKLYSYLNHEASPFYVRENGVEEMIDKALETLEKYPKELFEKKMKEFNENYGMASDEYKEEWDKTEREMYEEVTEARKGTGYWPWTPKNRNEQ